MHRRGLVVGALLALALTAAACGSSGGDGTGTGSAGSGGAGATSPAGGGGGETSGGSSAPTELRVAMALMPKGPSLDPMLNTYSNPEFTNIYDALTQLDSKGQIQPDLATEWKNVNPTTWEFTLRSNVTFQNGEEFTADDVKYSFDRIKDPANKSPKAVQISEVSEVKVVNPTTVQIITDEPDAALPAGLTLVQIVPKDLIEKIGNEAFAQHPVGTGPFKFVEWVKDSRIVLEANKDYWAGPPGVDKVTFLSAPEASTRVAMLMNGEADLVEQILNTDVPRIEADSNLQIIKGESTYTNYIAINTHKEPFTDVRVRQAMAYAIDMDTIIKNITGGNGSRINISISHLDFGYNKDLPPRPYDPDKAKQLLAEAGYGPGGKAFPPIKIDVGTGRQPYNISITQAIAGYWTDAGMPASVNVMESAAEFEKYVSGKATLIYNGTRSNSADAGEKFSLIYYSKARGFYWSTPEMDKMVLEAAAEMDPAKRAAMYQEMSQIVYDAVPDIPILDTIDVFGASAKLAWDGEAADGSIPLWSAKMGS